MLSQVETRKYQLFPKENHAMNSQGKGLDPEQAFALAMGQNGDKAEKAHMSSLRTRMREHNLSRRRKVSVTELGPMTTVHEATIDSPTLPGRSTCHERSISAPVNDWRHHNETESNIIFSETSFTSNPSAITSRQPQSPRDLPPLMIPVQTSSYSRLTRQCSKSRLRSGSAGSSESSLRSARTDDSPRSRTPYTPLSGTQTTGTPMSAMTLSSTQTASTLHTPVSATTDCRVSPRDWKSECSTTVLQNSKENVHDCTQNITTPRSSADEWPTSGLNHHRRNTSESSSICGSIMDRGRPKKKNDTNTLKRSGSKRSKSAERRAFESLPKGWKAPDAVQMLDQSEIVAIQKQAAQQAARFEIMRKEDVDSLSRELRNLDERAEYLRRTYHSLRTGRRNLHSRICQYLRSPRVAKFNHEPMLKQEEALAELDASIDEWVHKLEQTENRRTRIRQKLLEHVAAAVALPKPDLVGASESLHIAMGVARPFVPTNLSTPPRSPVRIPFTPPTRSSSPPPQRALAQIPSTILEQPIVEEAAAFAPGSDQPDRQEEMTGETDQKAGEPHDADMRRTAGVESIRIYAGDEVTALLADVEQQMVRMSKAADHAIALKDTDSHMSDEERRELHRAHSHEMLQGGMQPMPLNACTNTASTSSTTKSSLSNSTPRTATPTIAEAEENEPAGFLLTNAVFNPQTAVPQ